MVLFLYNSSAYVSSFLFFQVRQNGFGVTNQLEPFLSEQGSHSEFCLVAQNHRREVESNQVKQWCCAFEFRGHNAQTYMLLSQMRTWKPGVLQTSEFLQLCQFYLAVRHRREENLGFFFFFQSSLEHWLIPVSQHSVADCPFHLFETNLLTLCVESILLEDVLSFEILCVQINISSWERVKVFQSAWIFKLSCHLFSHPC